MARGWRTPLLASISIWKCDWVIVGKPRDDMEMGCDGVVQVGSS